jgi:hypothetical protein
MEAPSHEEADLLYTRRAFADPDPLHERLRARPVQEGVIAGSAANRATKRRRAG